MQIVSESALCTNRIRSKNSLTHQGFELANGLPYLVSDEDVHNLLDSHTVNQALNMQIALGKIRNALGHYEGDVLAIDPHRIVSTTQRMMPKKKKVPGETSKKTLQTFFAIDTQNGQPLGSTIGSSGQTATRATNDLVNMCEEILPVRSLILADKEHFTIDLLKKFNNHQLYDVLMPAPMTAKTKKLLSKLSYKRQWAGFAIGETTYTFNNNDQYRLLAQRSGENADTYSYSAFITTSGKDAIELLSEEYDKRWSIEEFFNFEGAMGFDRASTFNLNIRYGKLSLAMIAQAATYEFRKKLPKPYKRWTAEHLAKSIFSAIDGDIRVRGDTIIVTCYNVPDSLNLKSYYQNLPDKLIKQGINPYIPWLYNFKLDFRFK